MLAFLNTRELIAMMVEASIVQDNKRDRFYTVFFFSRMSVETHTIRPQNVGGWQ